MVEKLSQAIQPLLDKPFVFFGHSMGALIAFELTRRLRQNGLPQPNALFISACGAPQILDLQSPLHTLPDDEFVTSLKKLNGIPLEVLQNKEMLNLFLPVLRADFKLIETYKYIHDEPLSLPIIVFGGLDDERVSRERLEGWAVQTSGRFEVTYFPGDHFFINSEKESVIETIIGELASGQVSIPRKEQERGYSTTSHLNNG